MNDEGVQKERRLATARALLDRHGLVGWRVDFADLSMVPTKNLVGASSYGAEGICVFPGKQILLDPKLIPHRNKCLDVVRHEAAHALAGPGAGHGTRWLAIARKVGCSPRSLEPYRVRFV
jgi:SprT protein